MRLYIETVGRSQSELSSIGLVVLACEELGGKQFGDIQFLKNFYTW